MKEIITLRMILNSKYPNGHRLKKRRGPRFAKKKK